MIKNILAVGDSFTYGAELSVRNKQSWPALLTNNGYLVTNLGVPGFSIEGCIRVLFENIDDGYWYDYTNDIVIKAPLYWMHIPLLPNE